MRAIFRLSGGHVFPKAGRQARHKGNQTREMYEPQAGDYN